MWEGHRSGGGGRQDLFITRCQCLCEECRIIPRSRLDCRYPVLAACSLKIIPPVICRSAALCYRQRCASPLFFEAEAERQDGNLAYHGQPQNDFSSTGCFPSARFGLTLPISRNDYHDPRNAAVCSILNVRTIHVHRPSI